MAMNIFPSSVDAKGKLSSSVAPSSNNDLVTKTYTDSVITVTVANSGSGNKYVIDGTSEQPISFQKSVRIILDLSDSSNSGHPLRFSTTDDGTHGGGSEYSTNVTVSGTPGQSGAFVMLESNQATPDLLYTYCTNHSGMGSSVQSGAVGELISESSSKVGIGSTSPSHKLDVNGDIRVRGNNIRDNSGNSGITFDGSANTQVDGNFTVATGKTVTLNGVTYTFPSSDGSSGQVLSTNGSGALSFATAGGGGGGGGSSKYVMRLAGRFLVNTSTGLMTHGSSMGNALGGDFNLARTDIGNLSNTSFTVTNRQAAYYYVIGIVPSDCTLDEVVVYTQLRYTFANAPKFRCWRGTFTNNTAGDVTWNQVHDAEAIGSNTSTTDIGCVATKSISSGNSFNAGDLVSFTFEYGGSAQYSLNQFTATLLFTES